MQTDRLKILLSHVPEGLLLWKSMEYWDVDLVFSGHVHGGQVRVPFVGGLFDPEEDFSNVYERNVFLRKWNDDLVGWSWQFQRNSASQ